VINGGTVSEMRNQRIQQSTVARSRIPCQCDVLVLDGRKMSDLFNEHLDIAKSQAKFYAGSHGESYESLLGIAMQELWRLNTEANTKEVKSTRGYVRTNIRGAIFRYLRQLCCDTQATDTWFVPFVDSEPGNSPIDEASIVWQLIDDKPTPEDALSECEESLSIDILTEGLDPKDRIVFDMIMNGASLMTVAREMRVNRNQITKFVNETIERVRAHVDG